MGIFNPYVFVIKKGGKYESCKIMVRKRAYLRYK